MTDRNGGQQLPEQPTYDERQAARAREADEAKALRYVLGCSYHRAFRGDTRFALWNASVCDSCVCIVRAAARAEST